MYYHVLELKVAEYREKEYILNLPWRQHRSRFLKLLKALETVQLQGINEIMYVDYKDNYN